MRRLPVDLVLGFILLAAPRPADARMACFEASGVAPRDGTTLPPHPFVVRFGRGKGHHYGATIDGARVPVKATELKVTAGLTVIEIDSERIGALEVTSDGVAVAAYRVAPRPHLATAPLPASIGRYREHLDATAIDPRFDGLGVWLPEGTPAISAHVRLREVGATEGIDLDIAVVSSDDQPRPVIRIGSTGCRAIVPLALLAKGVDVEITVMLASGAVVPVTGVGPHLTLPEPLPPPFPPRRIGPR